MKHKKKILYILPLLMLSSCTSTIGEDISEESFLSKLIPNWPTFVAQIFALIILILLFIILAYKPVKKILNKRADFIENNIKEAETNKATAIENARRSEEMILTSQKKADEIITSAKAVALNEKERIVEETSLTVSKMKKEAEKDIELAKKDATEAINKEIIEVALLASEQVLQREVSKKDNEQLAESFIKDIRK